LIRTLRTQGKRQLLNELQHGRDESVEKIFVATPIKPKLKQEIITPKKENEETKSISLRQRNLPTLRGRSDSKLQNDEYLHAPLIELKRAVSPRDDEPVAPVSGQQRRNDCPNPTSPRLYSPQPSENSFVHSLSEIKRMTSPRPSILPDFPELLEQTETIRLTLTSA
jgi:hypothetical protein